MRKATITAIIIGLLIGSLFASWRIIIDFAKDVTNLHSFADAVAITAPSVVNIYTSTPKSNDFIEDPLAQRYFKPQKEQIQNTQEISLGSGVIMNKHGYIVTNLHVIKDASKIIVLLYDGRQSKATVVGADTATDIAILKINQTDLTAISIGNSIDMRVGDPVLAIGNPYGFGQTVTSGIISAKGRYGLNLNTYENYIQTDAAINVGSSGGALINTRGELIGINTANYTQSGGSQGIALATPVETIYKVVSDIIQHGHVVRGWLGLEVTQLTPELALQLGTEITNGIVITRVQAGSPAQQAGLIAQDIIMSIDGKRISSGHQGLNEVADLMPGRTTEIEVLRKDKMVKLQAIIGTRPASAANTTPSANMPIKASNDE